MVTLPPFHEFIESVPLCLYTTAFPVAIALFERFSVDRIVVVDEQQHPIGLIQAWRLISYLQQQHAGSILDPALLEALPWVSETDCLSAIDFESDSARHWAVVDEDHRFLGLVDSLYLRKLAQLEPQSSEPESSSETSRLPFHLDQQSLSPSARSQWQFSESEASPSGSEALAAHWLRQDIEPTPPQGMLPPQPSTRQLTQKLQHYIAQFASNYALQPRTLRLASGLPSDRSNLAIRSLMQFLERLPLPLMLQTSEGEAIAQNVLWMEQFGDLVDPDWIQRDAAAVLELTTSTMSSVSSNPVDSLASLSSQTTDWEQLQSASIHPLCQVGATPNTCVCICPLKNGQERIVQLVKIPLGTLFPQPNPELTQQDSLDVAEIDRSFRLAAIDHPVDPEDTDALQPSPEGLTTTDQLWLVLAQDVTEQQQLTRELAAKNADLVHLNRLKDEFLACISHELRTPLTTVLGLSSLLKDQLSGSLNERQVRYAQLIHRSGRHLMAIVNDILDLTRIETGQLELTLEPVNIAAVCNRAFDQAQQLSLEEEKPEAQSALGATAALPTFTLEIEPELTTIVADEMRLRQMLLHLLSNALKFTEATGKIGLTVSRWEGWVAFTVWDTGIGIPAEKQHLIFQKFQQLENPLTRRFEGAGLGLVLTQRLARLHGGDISFTSQEAEGSQFTLLLPPTHPQPTLTLGSVPIPTSPANRLILVVEAVVRSIEQVSAQLTELGYRVILARSGPEAIEKVRRLQPFAVLLNPLLPTLSGWDVLTLLKSEPQTRAIPVIITGTRGDREQALRNDAAGFLSLPIVHKSLQQVLRQLSNNEPPSSRSDADPSSSLVVLRLSPTRYSTLSHTNKDGGIDLNTLLHQQNYRVLEADDLEQAELLAQVWKPSVVLLDSTVPDLNTYLKLLSDCTFLASLPLVTLDPETTQAANQTPGLSVFPCLAPLEAASIDSGNSMLLQVIQVAAGFAWRPAILAIDASAFMAVGSSNLSYPETDWLPALMQYLHAAGFRGMVARSQSEAEQKLESQIADLLLVYWHHDRWNETALEALSDLKQRSGARPILVIHSQTDSENLRKLEAIATHVVPLLSMEDLLEQINQLLTD